MHIREQIKSMTCMTVISLITPPPSLSLCVRGEKPSAILFLACRGAVASPMVLFYHSGICVSIVSGDFTVCLFGWKAQQLCRGDGGCFLHAVQHPGTTKTRPSLIYARPGRAVYRCYLYALSETCQTPIYGLASRVALRGSKWNRHCRRAARRQRRGVGLRARSGVEAGTACPLISWRFDRLS